MDHSVVLVGWYANSHGIDDTETDPDPPVETCVNTKWYSNCTTGNDGGSGGGNIDPDKAFWLI